MSGKKSSKRMKIPAAVGPRMGRRRQCRDLRPDRATAGRQGERRSTQMGVSKTGPGILKCLSSTSSLSSSQRRPGRLAVSPVRVDALITSALDRGVCRGVCRQKPKCQASSYQKMAAKFAGRMSVVATVTYSTETETGPKISVPPGLPRPMPTLVGQTKCEEARPPCSQGLRQISRQPTSATARCGPKSSFR
jgi:hypothetical protein